MHNVIVSEKTSTDLRTQRTLSSFSADQVVCTNTLLFFRIALLDQHLCSDAIVILHDIDQLRTHLEEYVVLCKVTA